MYIIKKGELYIYQIKTRLTNYYGKGFHRKGVFLKGPCTKVAVYFTKFCDHSCNPNPFAAVKNFATKKLTDQDESIMLKKALDRCKLSF